MAKITVPNEFFLGKVRELLEEGHQCTIRTKGNSMLPFIWGDRDSVVLEKKADVHVDDIILADVPQRGYILHRVVEVDGENIKMMGDGNLKLGESCTVSDVAGTVIWIEKDSDKVDASLLPDDPEALEAYRRSHPKTYIDPDSPAQIRKAHLWRRLQPVRRIILAVYRRTIMKLI